MPGYFRNQRMLKILFSSQFVLCAGKIGTWFNIPCGFLGRLFYSLLGFFSFFGGFFNGFLGGFLFSFYVGLSRGYFSVSFDSSS